MILNNSLYKQHGHLKGVFLALKVTIIAMIYNLFKIKKRLTLNYPEETYQYSGRMKGLHVLTLKDDGSLRCTSCMLCATNCPADCIHIVASEDKDPHVEKSPVSFEIELLRCVFCGFCEEACPVDAIRLTNQYELSGYAESEWLVDEKFLSKRPSLNSGTGILSLVNDSNRFKLPANMDFHETPMVKTTK